MTQLQTTSTEQFGLHEMSIISYFQSASLAELVSSSGCRQGQRALADNIAAAAASRWRIRERRSPSIRRRCPKDSAFAAHEEGRGKLDSTLVAVPAGIEIKERKAQVMRFHYAISSCNGAQHPAQLRCPYIAFVTALPSKCTTHAAMKP